VLAPVMVGEALLVWTNSGRRWGKTVASEERGLSDQGFIDVRDGIRGMLRYRWFIIGAALLAAALAVAIKSSEPSTYQSTASLVIASSTAELSLEPKFKSVSDALANVKAVDRRATLVGLVRSPDVAAAVISQLGTQLPARLRQVPAILRAVGARSGQGDLVLIDVTDRDSATTALVANAWAREYESYVNEMFDSGTADSAHTLPGLVSSARADYELAGDALVVFTSQSRILELKRLVEEKQLVIDGLQISRQAAFERQIEARLDTLDALYATKLRLEQLLDDARSLQAHMQQSASNSSSANGLALMILKLASYSSSADVPIARSNATGGEAGAQSAYTYDRAASSSLSLELYLGDVGEIESRPSVLRADLGILCGVLESRLGEMNDKIAALSQDLSDAQGYTQIGAASTDEIVALEKEVQVLMGELRAETAQQDDLQRAHDVAWEAYSTVARKSAEVEIASSLIDRTVRVASLAVPPERPKSRGILKWALIAGQVALVLAAVVAILVSYAFPGSAGSADRHAEGYQAETVVRKD